jgi:hypothetical protein
MKCVVEMFHKDWFRLSKVDRRGFIDKQTESLVIS